MSDEPTTSHVAASSQQHAATARFREQKNVNRDVFNRVRVHLLDDLIRNLDILIYAQLSAVYYLDCYVFRFILRGMIQYLFLTPKPALFLAPPKPEPFVGAILGSNILCIVLHVFSQPASAGEATRFYLHGGLIIDFIGQKGPTSKILLVLMDVLVVTLQLVHLSAHVTRMKLIEEQSPRERRAQAASTQDLDSQERGVRRSIELAQEQVQEGIQLQALDPNGRGAARTDDVMPDSEADESETNAVLYDATKNGQVVLADLNVTRTIKEQIIRFHKTPPETRRNAYSAHLAGRMAGLRLLTGRTASR